MIEIVADRGYRSLKVRDLVSSAEVSTRAFYEHFSSKEDCFLQTHQLIYRRATRRIIAAQAGESNWRRRPYLVFEAFVQELERKPGGARLAIVEAYSAGAAALAQALQAERDFEGLLAEAFARLPQGVFVPPLIVQGMVAGIATVSRSRILAGRVADLAGGGKELIGWALSYLDPAAAELAKLDRQTVWRNTALEAPPFNSAREDEAAGRASGDRALILAAVADLAAVQGCSSLTAARVRSAAGVSRRKFEVHFDDLDECYLAALEQRAGQAMAQAARAQTASSGWLGGVYRAMTTLCDHVSGDPFLARVCLENDFPPGLRAERSRQRLIQALIELFSAEAPYPFREGPATEAAIGAVWALFLSHVVRKQSLRESIAATLTYLALAPLTTPREAIRAIRAEQRPSPLPQNRTSSEVQP
jgi:AcrR family transcriptional regulator